MKDSFCNRNRKRTQHQRRRRTTRFVIARDNQQRLMSAEGVRTFAHLAPVLVLACACLVLVPCALAEEIAENGPIKEVFVILEDGRTFALDFEPSERLLEFKERIEEQEEILSYRQKLSSGDTELEQDDRTLSDYNIEPGANLKLTLISQRTESYVYVKTLDGENVNVKVDLAQPVKKLKGLTTVLLTNFREPFTNLRLILNGRALRDDQKVLAYPIEAGTTVLQGKQLEDCRANVEILVHTLSGATIKCQVDLADTVGELKRLIEVQTGVPREAQVLGYSKNRLRSEDYLCDHGLESGASVNLALYSRRVRVPDDIGRLSRLSSIKSPYKGPIFREANDDEDIERRRDIFYDAQNWLFERRLFSDIMNLFNPIAQLELSRQEGNWFNKVTRKLCNSKTIGADDEMALHQFLSARRQIYSMVRIYRPRYDGHGIQLGASWQPGERLRANINNYAPDVFSDGEIMDMFVKSETIRRQLEGCAQICKVKHYISFAKQRELNRDLLRAYAKTLRRLPPMLELLDDEPVDTSNCLVCGNLEYNGRGIRLGASWKLGENLSLDINNYGLDVFDDNEIMGLFENYEIVRRRFESDARTGKVKLGDVKQMELNRELLEVYADALSGLLPMVKMQNDEQVDGTDCLICHDSLAEEPAVKLPCGHTMHQDCISGWLRYLRLKKQVAACPYCRGDFLVTKKSSKSLSGPLECCKDTD